MGNKKKSYSNRRDKKISGVPLTGIMMALSLVLLYLGSMLPAIESTFFIVGGIAIGIVICEAGLKNGLLLYLGTLLLGFFIVPDKASIIMYGCLFGIYSFVKYYAEKLSGKLAQIGVKLAFILVDAVIMWTFFREVLLGDVAITNSMLAFGLFFVVAAFFLYDYIFTLGLYIYRNKFKRESINVNLSEKNEPSDINLSESKEPIDEKFSESKEPIDEKFSESKESIDENM